MNIKKFLRFLVPKQKPQAEMVPFHDFETGTRRLIPKAELSPGVILVQIQGESAPVYAEAGQLKQGEYRYPPFVGEERAAIESLVFDLSEVYPLTYERWEDGFRRDQNPAREIASWLHTAAILAAITNEFGLDLLGKKSCFKVLVACATGPRDSVLVRCDIEHLSTQAVEKTIRYFFEGGYPQSRLNS